MSNHCASPFPKLTYVAGPLNPPTPSAYNYSFSNFLSALINLKSIYSSHFTKKHNSNSNSLTSCAICPSPVHLLHSLAYSLYHYPA